MSEPRKVMGYDATEDKMVVVMDLRDYFAAAALTGILAAYHLRGSATASYAQHAYEIADAMLAARGGK